MEPIIDHRTVAPFMSLIVVDTQARQPFAAMARIRCRTITVAPARTMAVSHALSADQANGFRALVVLAFSDGAALEGRSSASSTAMMPSKAERRVLA